MSYCRWGDENLSCDLYAYEDFEGAYVVHIAGCRYVGDPPPVRVPDFSATPDEEREAETARWLAEREAQWAWAREAESEDIPLPHAGETMVAYTPEEFLVTLLRLREIGYRFPDWTLEMIKEEIANKGGA